MNITKNMIMTPHIISRVRRAARALGNFNLLIFILQKRSTSGRPIIERTPETRMYTTILRKNQAQANRRRTPKKIRKFLNVVFMAKAILLQT
jgi:hypothetical protein